MLRIEQITADPKQRRTVLLPSGETIEFQMSFVPMQYCWMIDFLTYKDFTLNTMIISNQVNMLQSYKNQLPFGLGCFSTSDREPSLVEDFLSGASSLYILTEEDVDYYSGVLSGEV